MQVQGFGALKQSMADEPSSVKKTILGFSFCGLVVTASIGGLFAAGMANANKLSSNYTSLCNSSGKSGCDINVYDLGFFFSGSQFTDVTQANEYTKEIFANCADSSPTTLSDINDCLSGGSKWSIVWTLNAITMLSFAATNLIMMCGAYIFFARALGSCFSCLLGCLNLAAIIVTGVFRLNTIGKLAALSTLGVNYTGINSTSD